MMTIRWKRLMFAALAACGLWAAACGNMGYDEELQVLNEEQRKLVDDVKDLTNSIQVMKTDIETLQERIASTDTFLKETGSGGGNPQEIQTLNQNINTMSSAIKALDDKIKKMEQQIGRANRTAPARQETRTAERLESQAPAARQAAPTPEPTPSGFFAEPESGDTFETFAARHNTTPEKIREANRWPADKPLVYNQPYWIPR